MQIKSGVHLLLWYVHSLLDITSIIICIWIHLQTTAATLEIMNLLDGYTYVRVLIAPPNSNVNWSEMVMQCNII